MIWEDNLSRSDLRPLCQTDALARILTIKFGYWDVICLFKVNTTRAKLVQPHQACLRAIANCTCSYRMTSLP